MDDVEIPEDGDDAENPFEDAVAFTLREVDEGMRDHHAPVVDAEERATADRLIREHLQDRGSAIPNREMLHEIGLVVAAAIRKIRGEPSSIAQLEQDTASEIAGLLARQTPAAVEFRFAPAQS